MDLIEQDNCDIRMLGDIGLPLDVYTDQLAFIRTVRQGLSGRVLQKAVNALRGDRDEPYRDSRRLQTLRGWSHEQIKSIFP